jgi:CRISPR system Cascade subunit CasD
MSSETMYLTLRLEGPLQSWGFDSQFNRRNTGLMPTKSAVAGMCCAALGFDRGCNKEAAYLAKWKEVRMTAIAIPRVIERKLKNDDSKVKILSVRRLHDYHTVQNTRKADGGIKDCHITHRQYLTDASFGVILEGNADLLKQTADALADPVWGLWLGRKTCIPSAPVFVGLCDSRTEAITLQIGNEPLETFTWQEDVKTFAEGKDSMPDQPISFNSERRAGSGAHAPRRIITHQGRS